MKLNILLNVFILILISMSANNLIGFVISALFIFLNFRYMKSLHHLWVLSGIQSLILIYYSQEFGLICIALANVLYYYNLNLNKHFQNNILNIIVKRIYVMVASQVMIICVLLLISSEINQKTNITLAVTALFIVFGLFWILLIKKKSHD